MKDRKSTAGVDIGNSSVKVAIFNDGAIAGLFERSLSVAEAVRLLREEGVAATAYCTTRNLSEHETLEIEENGWWELKAGCPLPIEIVYRTPETLGADRVAAAVGAATMFPKTDLLVVDPGTALTIDFVSSRGEFMGGSISPGAGMRLKALHAFTSRLPEVEIWGESPDLGYDTPTAMRSGAVNGLVSEIAGSFIRIRQAYGCEKLVLTGGGAEYIKDQLEKEMHRLAPGVAIEMVKPLVHRGLITAYKYNNEISD